MLLLFFNLNAAPSTGEPNGLPFDDSLERCTQALADYLPNGRTFAAKNIFTSNLRSLLRGFAHEFCRARSYLGDMLREYNPLNTTLYLSEWEKALGIPDDCFPGNGPDLERRRDILAKLAASGIQTAQDIIDLAAIFGFTVTVVQQSVALPPYDVPFTPTSLPSPFVIIVQGTGLLTNLPPYDVPFTPGSSASVLECLLRKLIPANCELILQNTP